MAYKVRYDWADFMRGLMMFMVILYHSEVSIAMKTFGNNSALIISSVVTFTIGCAFLVFYRDLPSQFAETPLLQYNELPN